MCPTYESDVFYHHSPGIGQNQETIDLGNTSTCSLPAVLQESSIHDSQARIKSWEYKRRSGESPEISGNRDTGPYSGSSLFLKRDSLPFHNYSHSSGDLTLKPRESHGLKRHEESGLKSHSISFKGYKKGESSLVDPFEKFKSTYIGTLKRCKTIPSFCSQNLSFLQEMMGAGLIEPLDLMKKICLVEPYPHLTDASNRASGYLDQLNTTSRSYIEGRDGSKDRRYHFPSFFPGQDWMEIENSMINSVIKKDKISGSARRKHLERDLFWSYFYRGCLHSGATFSGVQRSNNKQYDVTVELVHISLKDSFAGGYLNIRGLTAEYPSLTTYFEAEIIGPKYDFTTKKWDTDPDIDLRHWEMFSQFNYHKDDFLSGKQSALNPLTSDYIFMRWKEQFLVPDHHITNINGASYDGFYYTCLDLTTGEIRGYYYYRCAKEWFEELVLKYINSSQRGSYRFH